MGEETEGCERRWPAGKPRRLVKPDLSAPSWLPLTAIRFVDAKSVGPVSSCLERSIVSSTA